MIYSLLKTSVKLGKRYNHHGADITIKNNEIKKFLYMMYKYGIIKIQKMLEILNSYNNDEIRYLRLSRTYMNTRFDFRVGVA